MWELTATSGTQNGRPLRSYRTVMAPTAGAAARELAAFVAELREAGPAADPDHRDLTVDDAMARFVDEHLAGEKGREKRTIWDCAGRGSAGTSNDSWSTRQERHAGEVDQDPS